MLPVYLSNSSGVTSRKGCSKAHAALFTSRWTGPTTSSRSAASVASQSARSTHTGLMDGHCGDDDTDTHIYTSIPPARAEDTCKLTIGVKKRIVGASGRVHFKKWRPLLREIKKEVCVATGKGHLTEYNPHKDCQSLVNPLFPPIFYFCILFGIFVLFFSFVTQFFKLTYLPVYI